MNNETHNYARKNKKTITEIEEILTHTKNYNIDNCLIIIPDKLINDDGSIDKIINNKNYKIYHINNVTNHNFNDKLVELKIKNDKLKNLLITNFIMDDLSFDNKKNKSENEKILKYLNKKTKKNTNLFLNHYCEILKRILNNLEYKWDWHNKSFLSDLSHQLKTPLTGLLTGIQILSKDKTVKNEHVIEYLFKSCLELSTHINNITDYYFINQNDIELNYDIVHVEELLIKVAEIYKSQIKECNNKYYFLIDSNSKIFMQDKDKIFKVLYNLINNSLKFTFNGYVLINVFTSDDGKKFYFQIYDTGKKVEEEDKEILFDPFYKIDQRKEKIFKEGIGLGLSICRKIINAMRGNIYFANCDNIPIKKFLRNIKSRHKFVNCVEFWFPINDYKTDKDSSSPSISDESEDGDKKKKIDKKLDVKPDIKINELDKVDEINIIDLNKNNMDNETSIKKKRKKRKLPPLPTSTSGRRNVKENKDDNKTIKSIDSIMSFELENLNYSDSDTSDSIDLSDMLNDNVTIYDGLAKLKSAKVKGKNIKKININKKIKILIVEDNKINSSLIKLMINSMISDEIQIDIQNLAREAYKNITDNNYDYILLDLRMPEVSGFDILKKLNDNDYFKKKNVAKIIVVTALFSKLVEDLKKTYPLIDILYKPIDINKLAELIKV